MKKHKGVIKVTTAAGFVYAKYRLEFIITADFWPSLSALSSPGHSACVLQRCVAGSLYRPTNPPPPTLSAGSGRTSASALTRRIRCKPVKSQGFETLFPVTTWGRHTLSSDTESPPCQLCWEPHATCPHNRTGPRMLVWAHQKTPAYARQTAGWSDRHALQTSAALLRSHSLGRRNRNIGVSLRLYVTQPHSLKPSRNVLHIPEVLTGFKPFRLHPLKNVSIKRSKGFSVPLSLSPASPKSYCFHQLCFCLQVFEFCWLKCSYFTGSTTFITLLPQSNINRSKGLLISSGTKREIRRHSASPRLSFLLAAVKMPGVSIMLILSRIWFGIWTHWNL